MITHTEEICLDSTEKTDFIDVTDFVKNTVEESKCNMGICNIYTQHTTTAIRINENEKGLMKDIRCFLETKVPPFNEYQHDDIDRRKDTPPDEPCNAHSHLKSLILGASESLPIIKNNIALGKWQRVFFVDLDGPRKRKMIIQIIGK